MKSKIMVLFLAGLMVIGSLSGCGYTLNDEAETPVQTAEDETVGQIEEDATGQVEEDIAGQVEENAAGQAEGETVVKEADANEYYETGRAYLYGLDGKEVDLESAYSNFEQAEELGKVEANFYLGLLCDYYNYPETDFQMASTYYEKCGDNPYAQLALGFLYYYGQGVEKDKERAKELWQSAIEQGCVEGYLGTACILLNDEEEYEAALEDYIKVSEGTEQLFVGCAMYNAGWMYFEGYGVEQDYALAMKWFEKAADLGNMYAMNNIGDMYCEGYGVEQDYETALEWYEKAADLGNEFAKVKAEDIRQLIQ